MIPRQALILKMNRGELFHWHSPTFVSVKTAGCANIHVHFVFHFLKLQLLLFTYFIQ